VPAVERTNNLGCRALLGACVPQVSLQLLGQLVMVLRSFFSGHSLYRGTQQLLVTLTSSFYETD
jgi:hypothetical protein